MTGTKASGALTAAVLATLLTGGSASAETYTNTFTGYGDSKVGLAWMFARNYAEVQARANGFTDPATQCVEVFAIGSQLSAIVIWECTR